MRKRWQALPDEKKFAYVMMSRMDRERAIYMNKLTQIKQNLLAELPSQSSQTQQSEQLPTQQQKPSNNAQYHTIGDLARS